MTRILGRSRSLRMLRIGHKETHQREAGHSTPPPADARAELDRLKAATPVTRADSRLEPRDMLQRPRTSGGPGDRGKLFHKKVAPVAPGPENSNFNFPFALDNKSTTILYTAEVHEDREGVIGIALGSPTMNPNWNTTPQATDFVSNGFGTATHISSNSALPQTTEAKQETAKPKLSRWKSIFGKKSQPAQEEKTSFYQLAQSVIPARADSHHDDESLESAPISRAENTQDDRRSISPPAYKADIRQSRKVPKGQEEPQPLPPPPKPKRLTIATNPGSRPRTTLMRSASSPKPLIKDSWNNSPTVPQVVISGDAPTALSPATGDKPLLDIDIPSVKLDRYSVMFSSLLQHSMLQPNSNSNSNSNRTSSLLVRRQGTSERLKPLNELTVKREDEGSRNRLAKPQRRATSPSMPKSPSVGLSLFPQPTVSRAPSPRGMSDLRPKPLQIRPLQRSKTAPAVSPSRQNFAIPEESEVKAKQASRDTKPRGQKHEKGDPQAKSQLPTPTPSSRRSFGSDSEEITISAEMPWKGEPEWEIISKPSQRTALTSHPTSAPLQQGPSSAPLESRVDNKSKTQTSPRSADRAYTTPHLQNSPKPQTQSLSQGTTVGVARSVSVSRASPRSAELLKPTLVKRATERSISPSSGRLVDQKPLTPTLVELKNRKSQRVQLVDV